MAKRKPRDPQERPIAVQVRGRDEWKAWLKEFAEHEGCSMNDLIDRALLDHARIRQYHKMPPER